MIIFQGSWGDPFDIKLYGGGAGRGNGALSPHYFSILQEREAYIETMFWTIVGIVVGVIVVLVIGFLLGIMYRKKVAEREISSAEEEAKRIINESIKAAESKKREALVEAREEIHKNRTEYEREVKERRNELSKQERRLQQKEENLDRKTDALEKKTEALNQKLSQAETMQEEIKLVKKSQLEMLEKISGYTVDEAKQYLISNVETEVTHEMAAKVREVEAR